MERRTGGERVRRGMREYEPSAPEKGTEVTLGVTNAWKDAERNVAVSGKEEKRSVRLGREVQGRRSGPGVEKLFARQIRGTKGWKKKRP